MGEMLCPEQETSNNWSSVPTSPQLLSPGAVSTQLLSPGENAAKEGLASPKSPKLTSPPPEDPIEVRYYQEPTDTSKCC